MKLEKNMGLGDRIIRPTLAAGMVAAYITGRVKGIVGIGLLALAAIFTVTTEEEHAKSPVTKSAINAIVVCIIFIFVYLSFTDK